MSMYSSVTGQILFQQGFLVVDAQREHRKADEEDQQAPVRAECQRNADHQDDVAEVHRVPDEAVPARRRQLLAGFDGDVGCGITVLDRHQHRDGEADGDEDESQHRDGCRHRRPAEAEVQHTDHDHGDHGYECHGDDDLLQGPGLGARARLHASAQGVRIVHGEIHTRDEGRRGEHRNERPSSPVVERTRGHEHHQDEGDKTDDGCHCRPYRGSHCHHTPGTRR